MLRGIETVRRRLGERPRNDFGHSRGQSGSDRAETRGRIDGVTRQDRDGCGPAEGRLSSQHLVHHTAKTIDIAAAIDLRRTH